jgi:hypothetical protein
MFLGAANHDPRRWATPQHPDPHSFGLARGPSRHVGFGMGIISSDPAGRAVVLCHDHHQLVGVVARLIDPALPEPHRFMPPSAPRRDDPQPNPRLASDLRRT